MRILLVEDEEKVSRFIVRGLKAESYAIDAVSDGKTGQEFLASYSYDLIILDLNLPGLSGSDLLQLIRKKNTTVPVIVLTARDSVTDKTAIDPIPLSSFFVVGLLNLAFMPPAWGIWVKSL